MTKATKTTTKPEKKEPVMNAVETTVEKPIAKTMEKKISKIGRAHV